MPIRLTMAYGERLASERLDHASDSRKDLILLCHFWRKLNAIEKEKAPIILTQVSKLVQDVNSAAQRLLNSDHLISSTALKLHERFELILLSAVIASCVEAFGAVVTKGQKKLEAVSAVTTKESQAEVKKLMGEKLENLTNLQVGYLIGASPASYVAGFLSHACHFAFELLSVKDVRPDNASELARGCSDAAAHAFGVWLASGSPAAKWISQYLNFKHQTVWASRVSDDVRSIQQALERWLQPTSPAAKKRADAWAKYRESLANLPDVRETMFDEKFGVRKVFVQPIANYKVAGLNSDNSTKVSDVANLIAGLISDRVPGDELILLCGGPGSGKSTLCRIIASEFASNAELHPIFLRLRRLQDTQEIASFIEAQLQKEGIIDKFSDLAEISNLVLILDGFDELVMATRNRLREFFNTLREDLGSGPLRNAKAIVSGRDTLFPNGTGLPTGSHVISLLPFDKARIKVWGEKWRSLHSDAPGKNFHPESFFDENARDNRKSDAPPLHHLVSWPLTLHLVARVHNAGVLDLTKGKHDSVEKAVLYKSIVAETALRQQEQSAGKGRLSAEQMREFVQAISWEMYSTSRDALEYTEGLPLLKSIYPSASEVELADLADVAIVNQPELTKGEEGGFEFVHKSFSEYFVAEKIARTIEKVAFKSEEYDSAELTWRMSIKEAIGEVSALTGMRVITAEVQEMLEPMLADFRVFLRQTNQMVNKVDLREKLRLKKSRIEELIDEYASGNFQIDVVERVRGSKIVRNEREIHGNFCVGLFVLGCALAKRLAALQSERSREEVGLLVENARMWKLISIMQAGDIQLEWALTERCLNPIKIKKTVAQDGEDDEIEVLYPPIPPQLLQGIQGVVFPLAQASGGALDIAVVQMFENLLNAALGSSGMLTHDRDFMAEPMGDSRDLELRSREYIRHNVTRVGRALSEVADILYRSGVVTEETRFGRMDFRYLDRTLDQLLHRLRRLRDGKHEGIREIGGFIEHHLHRYGVRESRFFTREFIDRLEYLVHRLSE
jgi:hypothetical protein